MLKTRKIKNEEQVGEYLVSWLSQKDEDIEKELLNSVVRNNIDSSVFKIYFIRKLEEAQISEIKGHSSKVEIVCDGDLCKFVKKQKVQKLLENEAYWGHIIAKILIKNSNKHNFLSKYMAKISFTISFFHSLLPFLLRLHEHGSFFADSAFENVVILCLFLSDFLFYFLNTAFLLFGCIIFLRKIKMLSHLSNLISPKKIGNCGARKIFPTLNFFNKVYLFKFKFFLNINRFLLNHGPSFILYLEITVLRLPKELKVK